MPNGMRMPWETEDYEYDGPPGKRSQWPGSSRRGIGLQQQEQSQSSSNQLPNKAFAQEMLAAHNKYRAMHRVPPLRLDINLSIGAQHWAQAMADQESLDPDANGRAEHLGENLAMKYSSNTTNFSGAEFTDYWYSGVSEYRFFDSSPKAKKSAGALSFTQMVWKSSRNVGFGRAVSSSGKVYVVARYYPPGNSLNEFAQNVFPVGQAEFGQAEYSQAEFGQAEFGQAEFGQAEFGQAKNHKESALANSPMNDTSRSVSSINKYSKPTSTSGAINPTDRLLKVNKSTTYKNDRTITTIEEKFVTQDGSVYTTELKTTFYGPEQK